LRNASDRTEDHEKTQKGGNFKADSTDKPVGTIRMGGTVSGHATCEANPETRRQRKYIAGGISANKSIKKKRYQQGNFGEALTASNASTGNGEGRLQHLLLTMKTRGAAYGCRRGEITKSKKRKIGFFRRRKQGGNQNVSLGDPGGKSQL